LLAQIVPTKLLTSATGLTSVANNIPMMVGPAIAGFIIGASGVYVSFVANAVAQCCVLTMVFLMRPQALTNASREPMVKQILGALKYVAGHPVLRWVASMAVVLGLGVRAYAQLLATFAGLVLHVDAKAYGTMLAVGGIGTVGGAIVVAMWTSERRGALWLISGVGCGVALVLLAVVRNFPLVLVVLVLIAFSWMLASSALFITMQLYSPDEMRGRAVSLFTMVFFGVVPLGALLMGALASVSSLNLAYALGGSIAAAFVAWVWITKPQMRET
jgi:predicted MFS family arabinose efflux permease